MIKKNIIELIHLLTDMEKKSYCSYNESKNFDKKIDNLIKYIRNIDRRNGINEK